VTALHVTTPSADVRGIALVLHGGRETSTDPVRAHQLAVLRMVPFARRLASARAVASSVTTTPARGPPGVG